MNLVEPTTGALLLLLFGVAMIGAVVLLTGAGRRAMTMSGFLVADREVGVTRGAFSAAVTFIWAPAVFVCSLKSFTQGVPGIFWFMLPNILCFVIFGWVASRVRRQHPNGFTLTEYIADRLGNRAAHLSVLSIFLLWMLTAITINGVAGGTMLSAVSGLDFRVAVIGLAALALVYSLISGMRASILTDVLQMSMALGIAFFLVPTVLSKAGGLSTVREGLGGLAGLTNPLDPTVTIQFGVVSAIGLIGGTLQDQMFYQRAYSVRQEVVKKMFLLGGLLFTLVPLSLSMLGFVGAALVDQGALSVDNPEMVGPAVIGHYLPTSALILFILLAFAGLASTLDSAFCGISSLVSVDIYRRYIKPDASDRESLRAARLGMLVLGVVGVLVALLQPNIIWVFNFYAAVAVGGLAPVLFVIAGFRPKSRAVVISVIAALAIALPSSIYGNLHENYWLIVGGPVVALMIAAAICGVSLGKRDPVYG